MNIQNSSKLILIDIFSSSPKNFSEVYIWSGKSKLGFLIYKKKFFKVVSF